MANLPEINIKALIFISGKFAILSLQKNYFLEAINPPNAPVIPITIA